MRRIYLPLLALVFIISCSKEEVDTHNNENVNTTHEVDHSIVQGEAIVKFNDEMIALIEDDLNNGKIVTRSMGLNQALDEIGIRSISRLFPYAGEYEPRTRSEGLHKWYVVKFGETVPQTRATTELESIPGIEQVENHRTINVEGFDDPKLSSQWGFSNPQGYDINVAPVWSGYTTGDPRVIVAVVDEGVDLKHEDLAANCGSDHYNTINYNSTVVAGSHGTHVAGTIAAVNNNGIGVCGIAGGDAANGKKGVTIMSCEFLREVNGKTLNGSSAAAIKWAADHGAVICQNSWAYSYDRDGDGSLNSAELADAMAGKVSESDKVAIDYFIKYAGCDNDGNQLPDSPMKGGLVVFAAGNEGIQNGVPANYEPVIAVAAINNYGNRATFSNFGDFVDIAAPGTSILSTYPDNRYHNLQGTSMACPHVSGVAALLVSYLGGQGFTCDELKDRILSSKNTKAVSKNIGGLVDAMAALTYGSDFVPGKVMDVKTSTVTNEVTLSWTAAGDAEGHPAYGYSIIFGKDKAAVEAADPASEQLSDVSRKIVLSDVRFNETMTTVISDLDFSTQYYVKVVGFSYQKTYGESSDAVDFTTEKNNPPVIELEDSDELILKSHDVKDIKMTIYDPDGHTFQCGYKPGSNADTFDKTIDSKWLVRIRAYNAEAGSYTAQITASDKFGETSTKEIKYTILENTPPQKIKDMEDRFFTSLGDSFTLDMAEYFTDADGEELKYSISLGNPSVAHIVPNGDQIIGTILQYGATTVTLTALDARNTTAKAEFKILAREASIEYAAYPNPVKDVLKIATGKELSDVHVKISSMTGSLVFDKTLKASAFEPAEIYMSGCAPGKYSATIKFNSKEYKQTIVKK